MCESQFKDLTRKSKKSFQCKLWNNLEYKQQFKDIELNQKIIEHEGRIQSVNPGKILKNVFFMKYCNFGYDSVYNIIDIINVKTREE